MSSKFQEYKTLDLHKINLDILKFWDEHQTFAKSISSREGHPDFVFYEGPPSANGMPGIHHVISRTIKDIICRFKTLQGFRVERKAGWDTHGLPVELGVEKSLGITKEDIGKSISIAEYNEACRKDVMKYTDHWEDLTRKVGFWLDMDHAYITYDNRYIETLWWLLKQLYEKDYLTEGYTIQPYSPAAGTGLSTHELNQPGCYRDVKDTTVVAMMKVIRNEQSEFLFRDQDAEVFILAWTTTPWTLLSNTALAVGSEIEYQRVRTFNPYTGLPITVVLAADRFSAYFSEKDAHLALEDYKEGDKHVPFRVLDGFRGSALEGIRYEQLLPYQQPTDGDAFRVVAGDFVTTSDGTGIVHIAPSFGADDFRVARQNGIGSLTLVDKQGKFIDGVGEFSGLFVKNAYDPRLTEEDPTVDVHISVKLKKENRAFRIEKYVHSYPHCWRTDKPVLYYPLDSWFIRATACRDRMMELNDTINWKPASTGTGRFGKWLENLMDWNLSRSRFWGTPLPIWVSADRTEKICIGSVEELKQEIDKAVAAGFMHQNPLAGFVPGDFSKDNYSLFDLHRPFVDEVFLVSPTGRKMTRETDLIDVWFDSGAMPFAQLHYPFENSDRLAEYFPADFIAEGVDQTRGWFYTLHAIAAMVFDSVAFRNIISTGLVLDKDGRKMSKRLGNSIDPFSTIEKYGSDALRWYMTTNSQPWDNLKFDPEGVDEVRRKFFGTLYNTYSFFALYANVDEFRYTQAELSNEQRPELDRWILSLLNSLVREVQEGFSDYDITRAGRAIQEFVIENLSNWYVRLSRKRFWGSGWSDDKLSAFQTLYTCLETISILASPIAPFYAEQLFNDLNRVTGRKTDESVHLCKFPEVQDSLIDNALEERMHMAQKLSSMVLSIRRKVNLKVRQPLQRVLVPLNEADKVASLKEVASIIKTEVNVKEIEILSGDNSLIVKKARANFKALGSRLGKRMKEAAEAISALDQSAIHRYEKEGQVEIDLNDGPLTLLAGDLEIVTQDVPGWEVATEDQWTIALDVTLTPELKQEGIARELINRIQNIRKESGFDVTDKIRIELGQHESLIEALRIHREYISHQTLATSIEFVENTEGNGFRELEIDEIRSSISVSKC